MIEHLDHISLAVNDVSVSVAAYRRLLGLAPAWVHDGDDGRQAWFQLQSHGLLLIAPSNTGAGEAVGRRLSESGEGVWTMVFAVSDLEAATALVSRRGVRLLADASAPYALAPPDARRLAAFNPEDTAGLQILFAVKPIGRRSGAGSQLTSSGGIANLDHVVVRTRNPDRAAALYGARLGLDLRLDRSNAAWRVRQLFFRCGGVVVEVVAPVDAGADPGEDLFGGLAWRVGDADEVQKRLHAASFDVSEVRSGRKPGSKVMTLKAGVVGAPFLLIEQGVRPED